MGSLQHQPIIGEFEWGFEILGDQHICLLAVSRREQILSSVSGRFMPDDIQLTRLNYQ